MLTIVVGILFLILASGVLAQDPSADRDLESGIDHAKNGRYMAAIRQLERATQAYPDNSEAWYFLGVAYLKTSGFKQAAEALETSVKLNPNFAEAHSAYAQALVKLRRLPAASVAASLALSLDPSQTEAYYLIGVLNLRRGLFDEVIKQMDAATGANPLYAKAYLLKALALVGHPDNKTILDQGSDRTKTTERYSRAIDALRSYVGLKPDDENASLWSEQIDSLDFYLKGNFSEIETTKGVSSKVKIIEKPEPTYTEEARQFLVSGVVILRAVFASDGSVKHVLILKSLPGGLTEQSVKAAKSISFSPATINGRSVSTWMQLEYNFNLY